ncbi:hypothetical protein BN2497_12765 [Janthinobacterium sp. CG23_2]|nr:hypothetical protein BN2497_12765 [Janthinobacterium sp. CG23_2]CUU32780.1 hypothetical protein BN3177_12765 [Janthinobacterium sp. CG23_2]
MNNNIWKTVFHDMGNIKIFNGFILMQFNFRINFPAFSGNYEVFHFSTPTIRKFRNEFVCV